MYKKRNLAKGILGFLIGILIIVGGLIPVISVNSETKKIKDSIKSNKALWQEYTAKKNKSDGYNYSYKDKDGRDRKVMFYYNYDSPKEIQHKIRFILDDKLGENWYETRMEIGTILIVVGVILLVAGIRFFLVWKGHEKILHFITPNLIGIIICSFLLFVLSNSDWFLTLILILIFTYNLYMLYKKISRYYLSVKKPQQYKELLEREAKEAEEAKIRNEKQREQQKKAFERQIETEKQEAITSQQSIYGKHYFTEKCPYCGHYKVRLSTWDDKKMSVAFWGVWSDKVGKSFHCDYCKRDFND